MLFDVLGKFDLPSDEDTQMCQLLCDHHDVFVLEDKERGETDLVQLEFETGNSPPARQHPRQGRSTRYGCYGFGRTTFLLNKFITFVCFVHDITIQFPASMQALIWHI